MTKLYEHQLMTPPDELEDQFYYGLNALKPAYVLIGISQSPRAKSLWLEKNDDTVPILCPNMNTGSWINRLVGKRDMMKTLSDAVDKYAPIVFSGDNFLTKESRLFLFDYLPRYRKHAIVWEQDLDKMISLGYERPSLDEGFDDFTYII